VYPKRYKISSDVLARYIYTQFVAVDANFRLKLKNRRLKDVELSSGWAYYVEPSEYEKYLRKHSADLEVSTYRSTRIRSLNACQVNMCQSNLHAVDHAHKSARNYIATGVGAVKCARHTFIYPNGVGDLQKGERCQEIIVSRL
jgi:hypothetical protein